MNFNAVGIVLLVFLMLIAILLSFIYYLRHWALREQRLINTSITEGQFFKRYVPSALRATYDARRREHDLRIHRHFYILHMVITTVGGGSLLVVVIFAALENWNRMTWIDLTAQEVAALNYTQNDWQRQVDDQLPQFNAILPLLKQRGVVLVSAQDDVNWHVAGRSLSRLARKQWQQFLNHYGVPYRHCLWKKATHCGRRRIYVALPGHWDRQVIAKLLKRSTSLLFYGPPAQVFTHNENVDFYGLHFIPRSFPGMQQLAVVGDRQLTLGFDAGLVIMATPIFGGYSVQSNQPQAIGINEDRFIGGDLQTRLYAQSVGKGRLVWMDFSPNHDDQSQWINANHLQALNAAVFRYLLQQQYSAWASWPDGKRFAGILSEDTEDMFEHASKVLALVRRLHIPITWYILSNLAQRHRDLTQQLAAVGEIACHGDSHESFPSGDRNSQVYRIARCRKVLKEITGIVPLAFRPPSEEYNDATVDAVANNGMSYYFAEAGADRAVPVLEQSNTTGNVLVSLPRIGADDYELWYTRHLGYEESIDRADHDLYWANILGGLLIFDFHTQFMNDEHLRVVAHYAQRMKQDDVFLATARDTAEWWRLRRQLIRGESVALSRYAHYQPVLLVVRSDGRLYHIHDLAEQSALITAAGAKPPVTKQGRPYYPQ